MNSRRRQTGFTLLEVLIALAIVSVALAACVRALGLSAGGAQAMRERSLALQAAENRLAEIRLLRAFPNPGGESEPCPQGPLPLVCEQEIQDSSNSSFRQITLRARLADGPVLAELSSMLSSLP